MKFCLQLNPQVAVDKPAASLLPTLIEQVRIADAVGFDAFSMGDHYNIPGLQRLNQVPALARLCAEAKNCAVGTAVMLLGLRHPVTVASELASLDVLSGGKSFAAFGLGYRDEELNAFNLTKKQRFVRFVEGIEIIKKLWTEDRVSYDGEAFKLKRRQRRSQAFAETTAADLDRRQYRRCGKTRGANRRRLDDRAALRHR